MVEVFLQVRRTPTVSGTLMDYMNYQQTVAHQCEWVTRNLAYNLDFIPDDKLTWKPAPDAKSALDIVEHMLLTFAALPMYLHSEDPADLKVEPVTEREDAKARLIEAGQNYAALLRDLPDSALQGDLQMRNFALPRPRAIMMPVVDAIHHHGQIAYIQTLLGDKEVHFEMSTFVGKDEADNG